MTANVRHFITFFLLAGGLSLATPLVRVPNTTLSFPPNPPLVGYSASNAFPGLVFDNPVYLTHPPGETNRLFVVERAGRIQVITNLAAPTRTEFFSLAGRVLTNVNNGMMSLAFHPGYATNRFFYVVYSLNTTTTNLDGSINHNNLHQRLARFETSTTNANYASPLTELPLYTERDVASVHDPNDIQFGPDGYLYVSRPFEGPNSPGGDPLKHTQRLDRNLFGGFLRLDVDKLPGSLAPNPHHSHHPLDTSYTNSHGIPAGTVNYAVPADNPFIGVTVNPDGSTITNAAQLRTEFWALGLRNPFRFCFDDDGTLICGDVGFDTADEVNVISPGGNYGWPFIEGDQEGPRAVEAPPGFTAAPPVLFFPIGDVAPGSNLVSRALIGGTVYHGTRLPELRGKYIFGDNWQGTIWAATLNGTNPATVESLFTDATFGPVMFGRHPADGELLWANLNGSLNRLTYVAVSNDFPELLSDTGAFSDPATLTPAPGVVDYSINLPFWSDGAEKQRWFSVPDTNLTLTLNPDGTGSFPTGAVWMKHFELELTNGAPASRRRLETRFIIGNSNGVYGVTYRWGGSTTNAALVGPEGLDEPFIINDGGNVRTQVWHYPSRTECLSCHNPATGGVLGFNVPQLNRDHDYSGSTITNQLQALTSAGYLTAPLTNVYTLSQLAATTNEAVSREFRVRSYLEANCSSCHRPGGPTTALWDGRLAIRTRHAGLIDGELASEQAITNSRVVVRGSLSLSQLHERMNALDATRMPPIGSSRVDTQAVAVVAAWITNDLASYQTWAEWQLANFGATNHPGGGEADDFDHDGARNDLEFLTGTSPTNALEFWTMAIALTNPGPARVQFPRLANRNFLLESSATLTAPVWSPVDRVENRFEFAATNRPGMLLDDPITQNRFYRVKVVEP